MISGKEELFRLIEEGRLGSNIGLTIGSPKLEKYMDGLLPGTSYLVGGQSGTGKSTYMLWSLIYCPLIQFLEGKHIERDPYWIMFNLEMTRSQIYAKLLSMYIYDKFKVQLRFKEMFSRGEDCILTDEHFNLIKKCDSFIDELDKRLSCHDGTLTEEIYVKTMSRELGRFGHYEHGVYIPNNPKQIVGVVVDHMSLVKASSGRTKKDEMDAISRSSVVIRNTTKIVSPIHVSQFNRGSGSDERLKQNMQEPTQNDFKDSGSLYEDSQVVFALYCPNNYKVSTYRKYNIKILENVLIAICLLKSRFGTSNIIVPMGFYGDCGHYKEFPKPEDIRDYERYLSPEWTLDIKQENIDINETKSKFIL